MRLRRCMFSLGCGVECPEIAVTGEDYCKEHLGKKCVKCGLQAENECDLDSCITLLCDEHYQDHHDQHYKPFCTPPEEKIREPRKGVTYEEVLERKKLRGLL